MITLKFVKKTSCSKETPGFICTKHVDSTAPKPWLCKAPEEVQGPSKHKNDVPLEQVYRSNHPDEKAVLRKINFLIARADTRCECLKSKQGVQKFNLN